MLKWLLSRNAKDRDGVVEDGPAPSYDEAKNIAASDDPKARKKLAARRDIAPEFLYYFATDEAADVRRAVATNDSTPLQADKLLARDPDDTVRCDLAHKIGRLLPTLSDEENEKVTAMVFEVLEMLAEDQIPAVRAIIAEEIKSLDNVPPGVVSTLARDVEDAVCAPILQSSPLLKDDDLIAIIAKGVSSGALQAVASRSHLTEAVSQAVVTTDDTPAVAALLANATASIADKTMEEIVEKAAKRKDWHAPLANRANLPHPIVLRVASFVSKSLLDTLIKQNPLRKDVAEALKAAVAVRVAASGKDDDAEPDKADANKGAEPAHWSETDDDKAPQELDELWADEAEGQSYRNASEEAILEAVRKKDLEFAIKAMTLRSKMDAQRVAGMLKSKDPGKVVTLAWKADISASGAVILQQNIGISDAKIIRSQGSGYPLSMDERLKILYDEN